MQAVKFLRRPATVSLLLIAAAIAPACVSQMKYDQLARNLKDREDQLAGLSRERSALADFEKRNAEADARIAEYNE